MEITNVNTPVWSSLDHSSIDLEISIQGVGVVPFTASPADSEAHGREIFARAASGDFGPVAEYIATPVSVPASVSFFQGCAALQSAGYLDAVESYMSGPATAVEKLAWRTITEIRRASPLTSKLAVMLGLTEQQVDELFILAATIEA